MNKFKVTSLLLALFFVVVAGLAPAATTEGAKSSENAEPFIVDKGSTLSIPPSDDEGDNKSKDDKLKKGDRRDKVEPPKEEKKEPEDKPEQKSEDNPVFKTKDPVTTTTDGGSDPNPHIDDTKKEESGGFILPAAIGAYAVLITIGIAVLWTKYIKLKTKYDSLMADKSNKKYGNKSRNRPVARYEEPMDDSGESMFEYKKPDKAESFNNYGEKKSTDNLNDGSREKYIERKDLTSKRSGGFGEKPPQSPPLPEVKPIPQSPKKGIAEKFNDMMAEAAAAPGLMGKSIREKFARDYKVTPYKCVNFAERLNNSDIPPRFEVCGLGDSTLWGIPISGDKMAILPSLPAYEETAHFRGGMKELFESNYKTGSFRKIEVREVAVVSKDFSQIKKGELYLS
ncbi:MAG: hypothetical protein J6O04_03645 [Selenomonadaceae bacterium]|nr:hypothetical protein [Selenomonadaceae bacterium]